MFGLIDSFFDCVVDGGRVSSCEHIDGWYHNIEGETCIKMFFSLKNHQEALEDCQTRGAKLPIISTLATRDIYSSLIDSNDPSELTLVNFLTGW